MAKHIKTKGGSRTPKKRARRASKTPSRAKKVPSHRAGTREKPQLESPSIILRTMLKRFSNERTDGIGVTDDELHRAVQEAFGRIWYRHFMSSTGDTRWDILNPRGERERAQLARQFTKLLDVLSQNRPSHFLHFQQARGGLARMEVAATDSVR